ncbi:hypothetical protein GCM10011490_09420 [Pseudoclavibacter endophyticus]|uniref:Mycothiol-dependent maleylpyruvate isomerase metal-binding domain-containing protein n=1 Tax=Pseudoclavibacter endophyticus TaxID=1778590 RepID=A0A6H9WKD5_9MICO|nr:maleylpyruvate isomerase N-terminal domain-containing protein [Pseudoclavibacter endophyticus]KAB1649603.1 hypothetical protein F8O04_04970 [Pseudoclavibacter endophyticus]GGA61308.1 hypothetical protein GCM10011490_09420 [Pseudoclavibacter endophyticus]
MAESDDRTNVEGGPRAWFAAASQGYLAAISAIRREQLDSIVLGEWTLRDLLGHTSRAYLMIEAYVDAATDAHGDDVTVQSAAEYYRLVVAAPSATSASVAQRGRDAGAALGDAPAAVTQAIAARLGPIVDATADGLVVTTPFGTMRFLDYLETRAFELTVHGLDVVRATGSEVPMPLAEAFPAALGLLGEIATSAQRGVLLAAATGRDPLPAGFAIVS